MAIETAEVRMSGEAGTITIMDKDVVANSIRNSSYVNAATRARLKAGTTPQLIQGFRTYEAMVDFILTQSPDPAADGVILNAVGNGTGGTPARITANASTRVMSVHAAS